MYFYQIWSSFCLLTSFQIQDRNQEQWLYYTIIDVMNVSKLCCKKCSKLTDTDIPTSNFNSVWIFFLVEVMRENGKPAPRGELGRLLCKLPMPPGFMDTLYKSDQLYVAQYFRRYPVSLVQNLIIQLQLHSAR